MEVDKVSYKSMIKFEWCNNPLSDFADLSGIQWVVFLIYAEMATRNDIIQVNTVCIFKIAWLDVLFCAPLYLFMFNFSHRLFFKKNELCIDRKKVMDEIKNAILQWIYNIGHMYSQAITNPSSNPIWHAGLNFSDDGSFPSP